MNNQCVFCKIARKELPADITHEDEDFLAFLDINPVNRGHTLLIPKSHYANLYDLSDETISKMSVLMKKIAASVKRAAKADGINLIMNVEGAAGQIVPHAHFHIIPRFSNDGLRHWPGKPYANKEESAEMANAIRRIAYSQ
ncbi:HIT family protein [Candidatus Parcubacteria bacterium]|nr:MAG: HIT family protein [Candidatus Parcubacteria bacterium]